MDAMHNADAFDKLREKPLRWTGGLIVVIVWELVKHKLCELANERIAVKADSMLTPFRDVFQVAINHPWITIIVLLGVYALAMVVWAYASVMFARKSRLKELATRAVRVFTARSEIRLAITDAIFDQDDYEFGGLNENGETVTECMTYIALVVSFTNLARKSVTIDRVSLSIQMPQGEAKPMRLDELGPGTIKATLRSPPRIKELEPNIVVVSGITVSRYVRFAFNLQKPRDEGFQDKSSFTFTAVDSSGVEHSIVRPPGSWPSDPMQQALKRYGSNPQSPQ